MTATCTHTTSAGKACDHPAKARRRDDHTLACGRHAGPDPLPLDADTPAEHVLTQALEDLVQATTVVATVAQSRALADAQDEDLPALAVIIQDVIAGLRLAERDVTIAAGQRLGRTEGALGDGRLFTLKRTADRTEWDHEDWKRDVRRVIAQRTLEHLELPAEVIVVHPQTGEQNVVNLAAVAQFVSTEAQEVHGAAQPKSTVLKRLGLFAGDYAKSSPGGWKITALTKPTTEKDA